MTRLSRPIKSSIVKRVIPVLAIALALACISAYPASATDYPSSCPHGGPHPTSTFCLNPNNGQAYTYATGTWRNAFTSISGSNSSNLNHVNEEMWGYVTTHEDSGNWIEGGLRNGYLPEDPCSCVAYAVFYAKFVNGTETRVFVANQSADNSSHTYQFSLAGCSCTQDFFYDYTYEGAAVGLVSANLYDIQAGLEAPADVSSGKANTFDMIESSTPAGGTNALWPSHHAAVDRPCGSYVAGQCLNGMTVNSYEWRNNIG